MGIKVKVRDLVKLLGGRTKVIILDGFVHDVKYGEVWRELWRGQVDDIDFNNIPYGERVIEHVTVIEGEDWLQICI